MMRPLLSTVVLLALGGLPASARELLLETRMATSWDDSFVLADRWDVNLVWEPTLRLLDQDGRFTYDFSYRPGYEAIYRINGANAWDHGVTGRLGYQLSPASQLFVNATFSRQKTVSSKRLETFDVQEGEEAEAGAGRETDPSFTFGNERTKRWSVSAGLQHTFRTNLIGQLQLSQSESQTQQVGRSSSLVRSASANLTYQHSGRNTLGVATSWTKTSFASDTNRYLVQFTWTHRFDATWFFVIKAGPQFAKPDEPDKRFFLAEQIRYPFLFDTTGCPEIDGFPVLDTSQCAAVAPVSVIEDDLGLAGLGAVAVSADRIFDQFTDLGLIGRTRIPSAETSTDLIWSLEMSKSWARWAVRVNFSQSEGGSETLGSSIETQRLTVRVSWEPTSRWVVTLRGGWLQQTSQGVSFQSHFALRRTTIPNSLLEATVLGIPLPGDFPEPVAEQIGIVFGKTKTRSEFTTFDTSVRVRRTISRRLSVFGSLTYRKRSSESEFGDAKTKSSSDSTRIDLGFVYKFDPIYL